MLRKLSIGSVAVLFVVYAAALAAQQPTTKQLKVGGGGSPHMQSEWTIHGAHITITYGSPYLKGRTLGKEVVPFGKEWRTGADEATTIVSDKPLTFGSLVVPAGTHTIYTLPGEKEWQLIISKKTGQWGIPYPAGEDLGRAPMRVETLEKPVESMTFVIDQTSKGGTLEVEWGTTAAAIDFTVGM
jgi:hypothetical protein